MNVDQLKDRLDALALRLARSRPGEAQNIKLRSSFEAYYMILGVLNKYFTFFETDNKSIEILNGLFEVSIKFIKKCLKFNELEKIPNCMVFLIKIIRAKQQYQLDNTQK